MRKWCLDLSAVEDPKILAPENFGIWKINQSLATSLKLWIAYQSHLLYFWNRKILDLFYFNFDVFFYLKFGWLNVYQYIYEKYY